MNKPKSFLLDDDHAVKLMKYVTSGMTPAIIRQRAAILLAKAEGKSNQTIADEIGVNRHTVDLWVRRYRERKPDISIDKLLNVAEGRGKKGRNYWRSKILAD